MMTRRPGMPYAGTPLAKLIAEQLDVQARMGKNQRQIAHEIGYKKPNMISMFKRGETKVPLAKVPALARALGVSPAKLFQFAVQQQWPEAYLAICEIFKIVLTENETNIVQFIRVTTGGADPELTPDLEAKLKTAFHSWSH